MNVLFVCKWNRFRSKAAEAIFNKLNKDPAIRARSAGLFPGVAVSSDIIKAGRDIGVRITRRQQGITHGLLMWSDYIIIVAEDVPGSIFREVAANDGKKVIHWRIKDVKGSDVGRRVQTMLQLEARIKDFLKRTSRGVRP